MAKTYVPSIVLNIHQLAIYITKYNSVLRAAIATLDPEAVAVYDTLASAVLAFDALRETLYPLET